MNDSARAADLASKQRLALTLKTMQARLDTLEKARTEPIAIVGIGCRFPGGVRSADDYWRLLRAGADAVTEVPPSRWSLAEWFDADPDAPGKIYTRWGGFLDDVDQFDARFFGISPREAASLDPQQRLLLEVSWEALEHAAISADALAGSATGVFVGISGNDYAQLHGGFLDPRRLDAYAGTGSIDSVAAGRLSYVLGLHGPNFPIDTACSSSLVALHLACQSLRLGECRVALAAGVNLTLTPIATVYFCKMRALSPTGRCRTFDAAADGYVRGEGCGVVVLKRLSDAERDGDRILALVRGSAVNHDGRSNGLTAPNGAAQEAVLRAALVNAGLEPAQVGYVEAHGTGTVLGDPIEVHALAAVLGKNRTAANPLLLGSVKTNLGHLEAAAGIAGLIKAVLVLRHGEVPPHLHLARPNPHIPWQELPVAVPTRGQSWPGSGPRFAGVSSFGFSGTNAHVLLEGVLPPSPVPSATGSVRLLAMSAKSDEALRTRAAQLADHIAQEPAVVLADVCATANAGRAHFGQRVAVLVRSTEQTEIALRGFAAGQEGTGVISGPAVTAAPSIAFLFTGQGAQYIGMGRQLYENCAAFRRELDRCAELLRPHLERPLLDVIFAEDNATSPLGQTAYAQPALFAIEYALAMLWQSWGVRPTAVIGHSLGEYTAACVAGVLSLEDALTLVATRARLMQAMPSGGAMAAVLADEATVVEALRPHTGRLSIAALNGPTNTVISGDVDALTEVLAALAAAGVSAQRLDVSHAFHSHRMEPALAAFRAAAEQVRHEPPRCTLIANLTGRELGGAERLNADYWCRHLRQPVRFADSVAALRGAGIDMFIEIGPSPTLIGMARRCLPDAERSAWLPSLRRGRDDWEQMLESLAALYVRGVKIDWAAFEKDGSGRRITLPTYPFQRQRFWLEPDPNRAGADAAVHAILGRRMRATLQEIVFERRLSVESPTFLGQHRSGGSALVAAAVYLEMALAGATEALSVEHVAIEELTISDALLLPENGEVTLQLHLQHAEGGRVSFEVRASEGDAEPRSYATGRLVSLVSEAEGGRIAEHDRLSEVKERCRQEVSVAEFYQRLAERGLELGPALQGVEWLARGDDEALARLRSTANIDFSPPLLDACLQVFGAAVPEATWAGGGAFLVGLERFQVFRRSTASLWSHARLRRTEGDILEGDVHVFAEDGTPIAIASGLRFRRSTIRTIPSERDLFYEVEWRPLAQRDQALSPDYLPLPRQLAEHLRPHQDRLTAELQLEQLRAVLAPLERLSTAFFIRGLRQLGWKPAVGQRVAAVELGATLGVRPTFHRLLSRMMEMLTEDGVLESRGDHGVLRSLPDAGEPEPLAASLLEQYPACATELALVQRCGEHLAEVLRGQCDPLTLLFGDKAVGVQRLYENSPFLRLYNALVPEALAAALARLPAGRTVRVVEIGAGTGGTTAHVLPRLPAHRTDYLFTDVSPAFLPRAADRFGTFPFVRYQVLDIERAPETQGIRPGSCDLVLAANVLHATADLRLTLRHIRQMLAPGGLLVLLEATARQRWLDLIFGLTEGWWQFADTDLRSYPLLSRSQWRSVLEETGFEAVAAVPAETDAGGLFSRQAILLARTSLSQPDASESSAWLIFADRGGVGRGFADELGRRGQHGQLVYADADIDPTRPEYYERLIASRSDWRGILHLWSLDAPAGGDTAAVAHDCRSALYLLQALVKANQTQSPRLWLITSGATSAGLVIAPTSAPLWGLGRVAAQEHPELWGGLIDLDPDAAPEANVSALLGQVWNPDGEDQAAFRDGVRHVARLTRRTPADGAGPLRLNADASYLITGGLGGLGLRVARWLVEQGARSLILVGRHPATDENQSVIQALETSARISVLRADVADAAQVRSLLDEVQRTLPQLRGVIHAAGIFEDSTLARQEWAGFERVLAAKVSGAWNLHTQTRDLPLDFFVLFSSAAAVFGPAGLGNYSAANAFLGALAHLRRRQALPALCVDWGPWSNVGMAQAVGAERERQWALAGLDPFPAQQGLAALSRLLAGGATQCAVVRVRWADYLQRFSTVPPLLADQALEVRGTANRRSGPKAGVDPALLGRLLAAAPDDRSTLILTHLRPQFARILNLDEAAISTEGNLLEQGLDSLMVMELFNGLKQTLRLTLYPREFYERPVLGNLARYLATEVGRAHGQMAEISCQPSAVSRQPDERLMAIRPKREKKTGSRRNPPAVLLLSSPRSGSTLLRVMLQGHPALFSPPELHLLGFATMGERQRRLAHSSMGEGLQRALMDLQDLDALAATAMVDGLVQRDAPIEEAYSLLQKQAGKRLLVDKTPTYASSLDTLDRAEATFADARYIFLTRHPYAVIESFMRMRMEKLLDAGNVDALTVAEQVWATTNENVLRFFEDVEPHRRLHVRYEDLVRDPRSTMTAVCDFLGVPFDPAVLTPYEGQRMTDGVHEQSLGLNDPNFMQHDRIEAALGEAWKTIRLARPLGAITQKVACELGYELPHEQPEPIRRERFVEVRGLSLCLSEWGPENGPTVVCVHGILEQGPAWEDVATRLAAQGYRVLAPDLRGHGRSAHVPASSSYQLLDFVADLDALTDGLANKPTLVGHSLGAVLATLLAISRPDRFGALVLVEKPLPSGAADEAADLLAAQLDHLATPPRHPLFPNLAAAVDRLRQATPALSEARAQALAERVTKSDAEGLRWRWDARLRTRVGITQPGLELPRYLALLRRLELPLYLVYGSASGVLKEGQLAALLEALPHARRFELTGGHNLHLEAPAELARLIAEAAGGARS